MDSRGLHAAGVHLRLGSTAVLAGADLTLRSGSTLAVTGASGSGKSSLLYVLAGLLSPDEGSVTLDGVELTRLREKERRAVRLQKFGFVFQSSDLLVEMSLLENVAMPLLLQGRSRKDALVAAAGWMDRLDIGGLAERRPSEVSGGQRQRAAVARAMVHGPRVVLADEPTGALDDNAASGVLESFLQSAREEQSAVLVVTHDAEVARACDQQLGLDGGRLTLYRAAATAQ